MCSFNFSPSSPGPYSLLLVEISDINKHTSMAAIFGHIYSQESRDWCWPGLLLGGEEQGVLE